MIWDYLITCCGLWNEHKYERQYAQSSGQMVDDRTINEAGVVAFIKVVIRQIFEEADQ